MRKVIVGVLLMMVVGVGGAEAGKVAEVKVVGVASASRVPAYWWKYVEWHQEGKIMGGGYGTEE